MGQVWSRCSVQPAADSALHERCAAAVTPAAVLPPSALTKVTTFSHSCPELAGMLQLESVFGARDGNGKGICWKSWLSTPCREF